MHFRVAVAVVVVAAAMGSGCSVTRAGRTASDPAFDRTEDIRQALDSGRARNVILLIGDGMADDEIGMARNYHVGAAGRLHLDDLPFTGDYTTYAVEEADPTLPDYVPDSASTATAWSTGKKTSDRRISTSAKTDLPLETILELAQRNGLRVGNVTTADITDATPAAAAAHINHRKCVGPEIMEKCTHYRKAAGGPGSIAEQLVDHKIDVLLGGGRNTLAQRIDGGPHAGRTVVESAVLHGYRVVDDAQQLAAISSLEDGPVLGLFAAEHFPPQWQGTRAMPYPCSGPQQCDRRGREPHQPTLTAMMQKALELLDGDAGFYLQVEGAIIDRCAHAADPCGQIGETVEFDEAVGAALEYADAHPDTLVIVTADHAHATQVVDWMDDEDHTPGLCSRLTTPEGAEMKVVYGTNVLPQIQQHTGAQVRVAARGPRAANVLGVRPQTALYSLMASALGLLDEGAAAE